MHSCVRRLARLAAACSLLPAHHLAAQAQSSSDKLATQITYRAIVPPSRAKVIDLWIPLPSDNAFQQISQIEVDASAPHRIATEPKHGNRIVHVRLENPASGAEVRVRFNVLRSRASSGERSSDSDRYLRAEARVPIGGRYAEIAREVTAGKQSQREKALAIYEHVVSTMQYDYKKESPKLGEGDTAFVCDYKKGNCSDLHSYMISLLRSSGIPAYLEYGFPLSGIPVPEAMPKAAAISGYHCWTWAYLGEDGWTPIDASDGRRWLDSKRPDVKESLFGKLVLHRSAVAFSRGRDIDLVPKQQAGPLNDFIYPYAEADGEPLKPGWEVSYRLLSEAETRLSTAEPQAGVSVVEDLRKLVLQQAREIAALREQLAAVTPAKGAAAPPPPVTAASKEQIGVYGFLRVDTILDGSQTNAAQTPFFVQSPSNANVAGRGNSQLVIHPRLTRLGFNFTAFPELSPGMSVTGKFEMDFQNGQGTTSESRPLPRLRHGYLQVQRGPHTLLFGQTWDLISPLFPSPNDDTLQWNAGNLGDRRAQLRYTHAPKSSPWSAAFAAGLTGALDAKDLDANTIRDGEDSGLPNFQGRIGWKKGSTDLGLWGHFATETTTKPVAGRRHFDGFSVGLDLATKLGARTDLRGELWLGENLSDVRGGIGQGINTATGRPVRSHGGWLELGYQSGPKHRIALGFTKDDPINSDIGAGGRLLNYSAYLHNKWRLGGNIDLGASYLYWLTRWNGMATGIDHRFNTFLQHNF